MTENVLTEDKYGKSALLPMAIKIPFFFFFREFFSEVLCMSASNESPQGMHVMN